MAEEPRERWLNYLALTTVILAVCATLSTFKGGGYSTRSVLAQTQAANQWSYYQAKSIKGYLYEIQKEAEKWETVREDAKVHSDIFGKAVIFLQIAILLSSIAALLKKKYIWVLGASTGVVGIVYFVNGFVLFF